MPHTKENRKAYLLANKERLGKVAKVWREKNRTHLATYMKDWHQKNKERIAGVTRLRRLGITPKQFAAKMEEQGGLCGLCNLPFTSTKPKDAPRADHDHSTGVFRGVLHRHCNLGLGTFHEDVSLLEKAIEYLKKHKGENR